MSTGTCHQATPNRPDLARVTGMAQLVGHLFLRAMASETMHAVNTTGAPQLPEKILGETQPCLQAAAFVGAADKTNTVAILNICNQSIDAAIVAATNASQQVASFALARTVSYDLADHGGKARPEPGGRPLASAARRQANVADNTAGHAPASLVLHGRDGMIGPLERRGLASAVLLVCVSRVCVCVVNGFLRAVFYY